MEYVVLNISQQNLQKTWLSIFQSFAEGHYPHDAKVMSDLMRALTPSFSTVPAKRTLPTSSKEQGAVKRRRKPLPNVDPYY